MLKTVYLLDKQPAVSPAHVDVRRPRSLSDGETRSSLQRIADCVFENFEPLQLLLLRPAYAAERLNGRHYLMSQKLRCTEIKKIK